MRNFIRHVGIVVNDLEGAKDFWIKIIGLTPRAEMKEPSPFIDELIAVSNPELTTLKLIDSNGFIIELLKFKNQQIGKSWTGSLNTVGLTHIAITVHDLDNIIDNIKFNNYNLISEIKNSPDNNVRVVFIRGPEGLMVELVQEMK
jgi:catechol 2,3-dioxygenase-like lactoylglutathione lyase family enzyme